MILRSGKRKLDEPYQLRSKRRKLNEEKQALYINDINTFEPDIQRIYKVTEPTAYQIMCQRDKKPFKSMDDLIARMMHDQVTEENIAFSSVELKFKTRFEEKSEEMYDTLMNMKSLEDQPPDTIKIISDFATGVIKTCDNPRCDGEILVMNEKPDQNGKIFKSGDVNTYTYYQESHGISYYHRISKKSGDVMYCDECTKNLRHCRMCNNGHYFKNRPSTYLVCRGRHKVDHPAFEKNFKYKMCRKCRGYCHEHSWDNTWDISWVDIHEFIDYHDDQGIFD